MSYTAGSFVADEIPTTTKWNSMWNNDASFNDGSGIANLAILSRHIAGIDKSILTTDSNPYNFSAYRAAAWTTGNNAYAKVPCETENYDTNNNYDTVNNRYVAPVTGYYHFDGRAGEAGTASGAICIATLYKNGVEIRRGSETSPNGVLNTTAMVSATILLTAGDYVELWRFGNNKAGNTGAVVTSFEGFLAFRT